MGWASTDDRTEWAVDVAAAAIFAAAVGFALWAAPVDGERVRIVVALAAFLLVCAGLRCLPAAQQSYALPAFAPVPIEPTPEAQDDATDELILQDLLARVSPDARVVRLFVPGQSHRHSSPSAPAAQDASQALSDALADLRRSLR